MRIFQIRIESTNSWRLLSYCKCTDPAVAVSEVVCQAEISVFGFR